MIKGDSSLLATKPKCLLTGAFGFLGRMFQVELSKEFELITLGRTTLCDIVADLTLNKPNLSHNFDWVVHNAGKAHIMPHTKEEEDTFWELNHQGTLRLLKSIDDIGHYPHGFVFISTIAVYGLDEGINITEDTPLNGNTPYALSKIAAEQAIQEWGAAHNVPVLILRLPLIGGPNPPGNLGLMERAMRRGRYVQIIGNTAQKSVVSAQDVARWLPGVLGQSGIYHLTDGIHPTFERIEQWMLNHTKGKVAVKLPSVLLRIAAGIGDILPFFPLNTLKYRKLTASLTFSDEKARRNLGWAPAPAFP